MGIETLYKHREGQTLVVAGHLSKYEIKALINNGWRFEEPMVNKHGIKVS
ncbi:hypothetical protein [Virgibacillus sp. Bac332]|nr:hypothetical protein [Virgibacillus sp. Bac332]